MWKLIVKDDNSATLICEDGNDNVVFTKPIPFTWPVHQIRPTFVVSRFLHRGTSLIGLHFDALGGLLRASDTAATAAPRAPACPRAAPHRRPAAADCRRSR